MTFAQEPATANYPSVPATAIAARVVDFVLPPREIATELARLGADPRLAGTEALSPGAPGTRRRSGARRGLRPAARRLPGRLSAYKLPTIRRRLARRVLLRRCTGLGEYLALLRSDPAEIEALYFDILIMVTEFFREPETFAVLREVVFPAILKDKSDGEPVRIWAPGCASGEEPYSLAITALEVMETQGAHGPRRDTSPPTSTRPICGAPDGPATRPTSRPGRPRSTAALLRGHRGHLSGRQGRTPTCASLRATTSGRPALSQARPGRAAAIC